MVNSKKYSQNSSFLINFLFFALLTAHCSLLTVSCDLFNNSDKDYLLNIDEEIAWANAERLTVQVAVPSGWGSSPQTARCYDAVRTNETPRKGYPFTVEFSPNSGYGFVEWLAFGNEYTIAAIAEMPLETARKNSLNSRGVSVSEPAATVTGAIGSSVTVNVSVPVTLVPFCDIRPRLDQRTYPPVNPMQTPFPFDQSVNLWFTLSIKEESAAGNIRISAVHTSDENLLGKKRGDLFGTDGDLSNYYKMDFPGENRIDLIPKNSTEYPSNHLMLLAITVEVGPGIESTNGHAMDAIEKINFQTDTNEAPKVYRPGVISASRNQASGYFNDSTEWRNPDIDRRFNRITTPPGNYNTVYIRFSVTPPDDAPSPTPNRITVIERMAYDMRGINSGGSSETSEYTTTASEINYDISAGEYTITHRLKTSQSGIIQLVVLPWYNDAISPVAPLATDKAVAMSQYVTVVMDLSAPMKNASTYDIAALNVSLTTPSSPVSGTPPVYVYGSSFSTINVTVGGLAGLTDNGTDGGISAALAWSAPWTMDDPGDLYWYAQIGEDSSGVKIPSPKLDVYSSGTLNNTWSPDITGLTPEVEYRVLLKFEDRMGNVSAWMDAGLKVKYSNAAVVPVTNLTASSTGSQVTVNWDTPPGMDGAYVSVNGSVTTVPDSGTGKTHTFSTTLLNTAGVRSGQAVSNVTEYKITVTAYNAAGDESKELTIWNIPGMSVSETNPAVLINTPGDLKPVGDGGKIVLGTTTPVKSYVLMDDITLSSWTPTGTASAFQGKFYGNGHTITVNSISTTDAYYGIFGYVEDALIRDLRVEYANNISISRANILYFGGITGRASGSSVIRNIVMGWNSSRIIITNGAGSSTQTYAGMLIGYMQPTVLVENCYAGLNMEVTASGTSGISAGGITGFIDTGTATNMIDGVTMVGTVNAKSTDTSSTVNFIRMGGITGECLGDGTIRDAEVTGTLEMSANSSNASLDYSCGGIIGRMVDGQISSCNFTGGINIPVTHSVSSPTYVGGITGAITPPGTAAKTLTSTRASGNITVEAAGSGDIKIGGVSGSSQGSSSSVNVTFTNCESSGNTITFSKTGVGAQLNIGGFLGEAVGFTELVSCNSRTLVKVDYTTSTNNTIANLMIGGFAGLLNVKAEKCYSASSIEVFIDSVWAGANSDTRRHPIGGFAGLAEGNFTVSQCYATGSITVTSVKNEVFNYFCGGFAGIGVGGVTFTDCYATGNVMVDRLDGGGGGNSDGGGFVGSIGTGNNTIQRCFAAGKVTLMSQRADGGSAGGVVGYVHDDNSVSNSVAFGESVTIVTGTGSGQNWGRVASNNPTGLLINNFAVDTLRVYSLIGTGIPSDVTFLSNTMAPLSPNPISYVGATVIRVSISSTFWQSTTPGVGVGFSNTVWDIGSPVTNKGYPTLKNVGGTQ